MPACILVYADHLMIAFLDSNERFKSFRYASWSHLLADFGDLDRFGLLQVRPSRVLL